MSLPKEETAPDKEDGQSCNLIDPGHPEHIPVLEIRNYDRLFCQGFFEREGLIP